MPLPVEIGDATIFRSVTFLFESLSVKGARLLPATTLLPESSQPVTETVYIPFSSSTEKVSSPCVRVTVLLFVLSDESVNVRVYVIVKEFRPEGAALFSLPARVEFSFFAASSAGRAPFNAMLPETVYFAF